MKLLTAIAAGMIAAATALPVAAQMHNDHVTQRTTVRTERHVDGGYERHRTRRVCTWRHRHHQRVKVCRTVRR